MRGIEKLINNSQPGLGRKIIIDYCNHIRYLEINVDNYIPRSVEKEIEKWNNEMNL